MSLAPTVERDVAIGALALDCGRTLENVVQRLAVYGTPRADGANVVLVAHALTGSARSADWWPGIVGPGKLLDPERFAIVGINALGGCYGSTGPGSLAPDGAPYGERFPLVSVRDLVRAQRAALRELGIERLALTIGGSLGGMQALAWAHEAPRALGGAIALGAYDWFAPMGIALNAVAREAIRIARTPREGIELARKIAMLTYKSGALFDRRFERRFDRKGGDPTREPAARFDVEGYLDYQGALFSARMDPASYLSLTRTMDIYDLRALPIPEPFPALVFVGIGEDWLFPQSYVRAAAERYARAGVRSTYLELPSDHGHDAFLAEPESLSS
ncbi:MAG: homoserine O-acetyltransferase family protein [Vulcanimicrobiaceae bacterium]